MHVAIHQTGHQKAAFEIDARSDRSDKRLHALVIADVDNSPVANRRASAVLLRASAVKRTPLR